MANQFLSKFDNTGTYQSQIDVDDTIKSIVRDCRVGGTEAGNLTSYYIRNDNTLCKYEEGVGETTYDHSSISDKIFDIALNRDGSRLYFSYDYIGTNNIRLNYIETNTMTVIGTEIEIKDNTNGMYDMYINIDKDNFLWLVYSVPAQYGNVYKQLYVVNLYDNVKLPASTPFQGSGNSLNSMTINKNSECIIVNKNETNMFHLNAEQNSIIMTILTIPGVKDIKFTTDGKLVCLINDGTDSSIEIRSGDTYETVDYSIDKTGQLFYHLLLDSNNRIYADRYEVGIKERYRWSSDLTNETMISDKLACNLYNCDDTGYIHSEITGMATI